MRGIMILPTDQKPDKIAACVRLDDSKIISFTHSVGLLLIQ